MKRNDSGTVRATWGRPVGEYLAQFDAIRDMLSIERAPQQSADQGAVALADWVRAQEGRARTPSSLTG